MFEKKSANILEQALNTLAALSDVCSRVNWDYSKVGTSAGTFLCDRFTQSSEFLHNICRVTGQELLKNNNDASKVATLLEQLYLNGLNDPGRKQAIHSDPQFL